MFRHFRPVFRETLIADVGMDTKRADRLIGEGLADLAAFGRPFRGRQAGRALDEATKAESASGLPMFGERFPA